MVVLAALLAATIGGARVVARERRVPIAGWPAELGALRIAALADLHTGAPHITVDKVREVVASVNAERPDLILLLGDYVIHGVAGGRFVPIEQTAAALRDLRAPLGVFAVLGNHDWWYDGPRCMRALEGRGHPRARRRRAGGDGTRPPSVDRGSRRAADPPRFDHARAGPVPEGAPVIVLTHNPDLFVRMPPRVLFTLAGHTHGGQVSLPGIGTSIIPVRLGVPSEISMLTVER
jgi:predicted MPP superfamily phosphohydrolase